MDIDMFWSIFLFAFLMYSPYCCRTVIMDKLIFSMDLIAIAISDSILSSENCCFATQCNVLYLTCRIEHGRNSSETQFLLIFFSLARRYIIRSRHRERTQSLLDVKPKHFFFSVVAVASKDNNLTDLTFIDCVGKKVLSFSSACYTMWLIGFIIFPKCWQLSRANKTFLIHCTIYMEITNQEYVCALINNNTKYILVIIMTGQNMLLIIIIECMCVVWVYVEIEKRRHRQPFTAHTYRKSSPHPNMLLALFIFIFAENFVETLTQNSTLKMQCSPLRLRVSVAYMPVSLLSVISLIKNENERTKDWQRKLFLHPQRTECNKEKLSQLCLRLQRRRLCYELEVV